MRDERHSHFNFFQRKIEVSVCAAVLTRGANPPKPNMIHPV